MNYIIPLLAGFLLSCSHIPLPESSPNSICFEGEGRGRISFQSQRHLFSFESAFMGKKRLSWKMLMNFSLHGDEDFTYKWESGGDKWEVGGSFALGFQSFLKESQKEMSLKDYEMILKALGDILYSSAHKPYKAHRAGRKPKEERENLNWSYEKGRTSVKAHFTGSERFTELEVNELGNKLELNLRGKKGFKKDASLFKYELFFTEKSCQ